MRSCRMFLLIIFFQSFVVSLTGFACEMCTIPRIGRQEKLIDLEDEQHKWFFDFLYERQEWNELPAADAHELHHDGHDVHNKTSDEFYHFTFGRQINEAFSLSFAIPFVIRESIGVEHANLGKKETSQGVGDLSAFLSYKIVEDEAFAASVIGGVKFPTGQTREKDSTGVRYEPELQPGSGSFDYVAGGIVEYHFDRFIAKGNATYTFKSEGSQEYEFGDVFSTAVFVDYILNPEDQKFVTKLGLDLNYQIAAKDKSSDVKKTDSGGQTLLFGPTLTVDALENVWLFGNFLYPVYQDPGGVHQKLNFVWTLGGKLLF